MAAWTQNTQVFERREWRVALPAHPCEVVETINAAERNHTEHANPSPITVTTEDSEWLVVSFTVPFVTRVFTRDSSKQ